MNIINSTPCSKYLFRFLTQKYFPLEIRKYLGSREAERPARLVKARGRLFIFFPCEERGVHGATSVSAVSMKQKKNYPS